ncbi:hypothetical protein [Streptomyces buecherae]|uniref:Uncharacterized protein n=1 Tax=Streptomyces buecherae TaxID=2763006 RepID=A0A7H8N4H4_9ACTN|nr:hypothetical protein [Streptomyces buecherae]MBC3984320.1 hypothetical protein [Streptomyces buecherae]QKW49342.1 hypothetical protein HUT08_07040 [Streptomyces buecherae]
MAAHSASTAHSCTWSASSATCCARGWPSIVEMPIPVPSGSYSMTPATPPTPASS